jgi:hypothetical protein
LVLGLKETYINLANTCSSFLVKTKSRAFLIPIITTSCKKLKMLKVKNVKYSLFRELSVCNNYNGYHDREKDGGLLEGLDQPEGDEAGQLDHREQVHARQRHL